MLVRPLGQWLFDSCLQCAGAETRDVVLRPIEFFRKKIRRPNECFIANLEGAHDGGVFWRFARVRIDREWRGRERLIDIMIGETRFTAQPVLRDLLQFGGGTFEIKTIVLVSCDGNARGGRAIATAETRDAFDMNHAGTVA